MKVMFIHLVEFCRPSYKDWLLSDIYEDLWRAFLERRLITTFDKNGNLNGVLVYQVVSSDILSIKQIVGKLKNLVNILAEKFPNHNYAIGYRRGKLQVFERSKFL